MKLTMKEKNYILDEYKLKLIVIYRFKEIRIYPNAQNSNPRKIFLARKISTKEKTNLIQELKTKSD